LIKLLLHSPPQLLVAQQLGGGPHDIREPVKDAAGPRRRRASLAHFIDGGFFPRFVPSHAPFMD